MNSTSTIVCGSATPEKNSSGHHQTLFPLAERPPIVDGGFNPRTRLTRRALLSLVPIAACTLLGACQQPTSPIRSSDLRPAALPTPEPKPTTPPPTVKPVAEGKIGESRTAVQSAAAAGPPKPGGKVVWAAEADPGSVDALAGAGAASLRVWADLVYQSLVMYDENLRLLPGLAETWVNTGPTTWAFKLRQGVRFHDGTEFGAEDVRRWFEAAHVGLRPGERQPWFDAITRVDAAGKYEVEVTTRAPHAPLLSTFAALAGTGIMSRATPGSNGSIPAGTGPFMIAEYTPRSHVRYVKHGDYWEKGLPYLDEVLLKIVPDEGARVAALQSGDVTYARTSPRAAQGLKSDKNLVILSSPGAAQRLTVFNTRRAPFDDVRVRQAISLAVDRQAAIMMLLDGDGRLSGPIPSGLGAWGAAPTALPYRRDLSRARQLLEEAGHADGFEASITATTNDPGLVALGSLLAEQVKPLGITLKVSPDAASSDIKSVASDFLPDPDDYLTLGSTSRSPFNVAGWSNARYSELVDTARTVLDPGQRKLMYDEAVGILLGEAPAIWWFTENVVEVIHTSIRGYMSSFTGRRPGLKKTWLER
jgi:peptide/nickel transport system substrate-binding protein